MTLIPFTRKPEASPPPLSPARQRLADLMAQRAGLAEALEAAAEPCRVAASAADRLSKATEYLQAIESRDAAALAAWSAHPIGPFPAPNPDLERAQDELDAARAYHDRTQKAAVTAELRYREIEERAQAVIRLQAEAVAAVVCEEIGALGARLHRLWAETATLEAVLASAIETCQLAQRRHEKAPDISAKGAVCLRIAQAENARDRAAEAAAREELAALVAEEARASDVTSPQAREHQRLASIIAAANSALGRPATRWSALMESCAASAAAHAGALSDLEQRLWADPEATLTLAADDPQPEAGTQVA